jgi:hypothetical protein
MKTNEKNSTKVVETSKEEKVVTNSKKEATDEQLLKDLTDFNIENLIAKSAKGRSIWKSEFKMKFSENEKTARRKIRNEQLSLSKKLLHSILTKESKEAMTIKAKELHKFYSEGLNDFSVYSNVSEKESAEKFKILKSAYEKMKLLVS